MVMKMPVFNKQQAYCFDKYCFDISLFHLLISGGHHPSSGVYALMSLHQSPCIIRYSLKKA